MRLDGFATSGDVHLWHVDLSDPGWDALRNVLSADEVQRAQRFHGLQLQQRYTRCRAALRWLLSRYAEHSASEISFRYGSFGKPEWAGESWHFNVTHSRDRALIAVARVAVGVDVEHLPTDLEAGLVDVLCHRDEKPTLAALAPEHRGRFLLGVWTRKEAYCKAIGVGLQRPFSSIRLLRVDPGATCVEAVDGDSGPWRVQDEAAVGAPDWFVQDLAISADCAASVCLPVCNPTVAVLRASAPVLGPNSGGRTAASCGECDPPVVAPVR